MFNTFLQRRGLGYWLMAAVMAQSIQGRVSSAEPSGFEIGGSARVRAESRNNSDFNKAAGDYSDLIGSRFRLDMKFKPNERVVVFFQPQFTKIWGESAYLPTGAAANTPSNTSGATYDTALSVHQAFVGYTVSEPLTFSIGRKEFNYGDQLLVGGVGWNNVGRAFDLILGSFKYAIGSVDVFDATVKDTNVATSGPGERKFSGVYAANRVSDFLQNADGYLFHSSDTTVAPKTSATAYGVRLKSPVFVFDYRVEATLEEVKAAKSTSESQIDLEAGYTMHEPTKTRVAAEYFTATRSFDQLYPTGHKWLGYADLFSRRNIAGYRLGASSQIAETISLALDYHVFQRRDTGAPAYKFNGTAYGATGSDSAIASEVDLVVGYKLDGSVNLELGAAHVYPGAYLKANGGPDQASFYYLQGSTSF